MGVTALRDYDALAAVQSEWEDLVRDARVGSPFAHPAWSLTWARHFVPETDLEYVAVREDSGAGRLVGIAPCYRRRRSVAGVSVTTIQPIGTGKGEALTEVVHLVAMPERSRDVLRAVTQHLASVPDIDWVQLSVGDSQGWPLPQWLQDGDIDAAVHHRKTRPCVVLDDLPAHPDEVLPSLKRNLRESLRRARNRSAALGAGAIEFRQINDADAIVPAVGHLIRLHTLRSEMSGKVQHPNALNGPIDGFLVDAVRQLARRGLAGVHLAEHAGSPVAAQLVLSDGNSDFVSVSGLDPKYWDLNLNTMLVFNAVQAAVVDKRESVNLSTGPNVAKMRWSTTVVTHHDFDIVPHRRRSELVHHAYAHATLAIDRRQEQRRHAALRADIDPLDSDRHRRTLISRVAADVRSRAPWK